MTDRTNEPNRREPEGFTPGSGGPASERARELGWQTNEEERTQTPREHQPIDGGTDYDYGARDFGDVPEDTSAAKVPESEKEAPPSAGKGDKKRGKEAA